MDAITRLQAVVQDNISAFVDAIVTFRNNINSFVNTFFFILSVFKINLFNKMVN